jgi:hypothetical protein
MSTITIEGFINDNLIKRIPQKVTLQVMVDTPELKYLSFIVMTSAIEFLGACLDSKDFHVGGRSKFRFELAIKKLGAFSGYKSYISGGGSGYDLFAELRCGMVHAALPKPNIELTERADKVCGKMNMQVVQLQNRKNPRIILVCEDLYDDISRAATEVIAELKNPGKYHHNATDPFMLTDIEI